MTFSNAVDEFVSRLGTIHEWFTSEDVRRNITQVRITRRVLMITFIISICSLNLHTPYNFTDYEVNCQKWTIIWSRS